MDEITIINDSLEFTCEKIAEAEGFEFPEVRAVFIDPPSRHGTLYINSLKGRRSLSWRGLITDDIQINRRLLASVCEPGNLKIIEFETCDGIAVRTLVEITGLVNPYRINRSPYLIQAIAPDPNFESQTLHSESTGITVQEGGTPVPAAVPAPIGGGSSLNFILVNNGNTDAQPIFTIQGPGENFLIQNVDTGETINLNLELTANESVIINTKEFTAYKGSQSVFGSVVRNPSAGWISLQPGTNRIVFNASAGFDENTLLTVEWRDTYTGI